MRENWTQVVCSRLLGGSRELKTAPKNNWDNHAGMSKARVRPRTQNSESREKSGSDGGKE